MTVAAVSFPPQTEPAPDTGAVALAFVLRLLGLPADADKIRHSLGSASALSEADLLRAVRSFPVKARSVMSRWDRLARTPFPALAQLSDGSWLVLGRVGDGKVLAQSPLAPRLEILVQDEFLAHWSGRLVLIGRVRTPPESMRP